MSTPPLQINFSSFLISLGHAAMEHMGEGEDATLNLSLARQTIDVIGILEEKTRGNLDTEEKRLIDALLFELRAKFVRASSGS